MKDLPDINIPKPSYFDKLVPLPWQPEIMLCPQTHTRWKKISGENELQRDHEGEIGWEEMGRFVNKSYYDVFMDTYRSALDA